MQSRAGATMSAVTSSCHNECSYELVPQGVQSRAAAAMSAVTSSCRNEWSHEKLPQLVQSRPAAAMSAVTNSCHNECCHRFDRNCANIESDYRQHRTSNTSSAERTENSLVVDPIKGCVEINLTIQASCPLSNADFSVPASQEPIPFR